MALGAFGYRSDPGTDHWLNPPEVCLMTIWFARLESGGPGDLLAGLHLGHPGVLSGLRLLPRAGRTPFSGAMNEKGPTLRSKSGGSLNMEGGTILYCLDREEEEEEGGNIDLKAGSWS